MTPARTGARPDGPRGARSRRCASRRRSQSADAAIRCAVRADEQRRFSRADHLHHAGHGGASGADRAARHAADRIGGAQILRLGGAARRLHGADDPGLCRLRQISGAEAAPGRAAVANSKLGHASVAARPGDDGRRSARPGAGQRQGAVQPRQRGACPAGHQPVSLRAGGAGRRGGGGGRARRGGRAARLAGECAQQRCVSIRCSIAAPRRQDACWSRAPP